jgi:multicomponent Na+:H+ antiporter subunit B
VSSANRRTTISASGRRLGRDEVEPRHRPGVALVLAAALAAGLTVGLVGLPREHAGLPAVARHALTIALPQWHITEPVNEVVYGSRGFDTFGETFLLLAAVVSVVVLTRRREPRRGEGGEEAAGRREQAEIDPAGSTADRWELTARLAERDEEDAGEPRRPATPDAEPLGAPGPETAEGMTVVVRTATRMVAPVLAIAGLYLAAWGYSPGGGFPAGVVIVGVILFVYAAFGYRRVEPIVRASRVEVAELAGALAIVAIEVLGLVLKGSVSANFLPLASDPQTILSGGILQAFSGSELIEVATSLTLVIFALLTMRHDWAPDEDDA